MIFFGNFYSERVKKPARRGCGAEIVDEATKPDFPDVCLLIQSKLVLHTKGKIVQAISVNYFVYKMNLVSVFLCKLNHYKFN